MATLVKNKYKFTLLALYLFLVVIFLTHPINAQETKLTIKGDVFAINGQETFLLGISAFDAVGKLKYTDLDLLKEKKFNLIRIWLYWRNLNVVFNSDGTLKQDKANQLKEFIGEADKRGMIVDVTILFLYNGYPYIPFENDIVKMKTAERSVATLLKDYDNIIFDVMNEHDNSGNQETTHATIKALVEEIRKIDPNRIVTVSSTGNHIINSDSLTELQKQNIREELNDIKVDVFTPHMKRTSDWFSKTSSRINTVKSYMEGIGGNIPIYLQEEERRNNIYTKDNFIEAATKAKNSGAAGWNFHTEAGFNIAGKSIYDYMDSVEKDVFNSIGDVFFPPSAVVCIENASSSRDCCLAGERCPGQSLGQSLDCTGICCSQQCEKVDACNDGTCNKNIDCSCPDYGDCSESECVTYTCLQNDKSCLKNLCSAYSSCTSAAQFTCESGEKCCSGDCSSSTSSDVISALSPGDYETAKIQQGITYYTDRSLIINSFPPDITDAILIKTANDDKKGGRVAFTLLKNADIYIGVDPRASNTWVSGLSFVGDLATSDKTVLKVYKKNATPGKIILEKNNCVVDSCSMYIVALVPEGMANPCHDNDCAPSVDCSCAGYGDCGSSKCGQGSGDYKKIAQGMDPAIAIDKDGNAHISYDCDCNPQCQNVCYLKYTKDGAASPQKVGKGWNSAIALDSSGNPHIVFQTGANNEGAIAYNKLVNGVQAYGLTGREITPGLQGSESIRIEKPRIAINSKTDNVYVVVQDVAKESVDIFSFSAKSDPAFFQPSQRTVVRDTPNGKSRPGNLIIDEAGNVHVTYSFYTGEQGIYYTVFSPELKKIEQDRRITARASDVSDIAFDKSGEIHLAGESEWATGIFYAKSVNKQLQQATRLFVSDNQKSGFTYNSNIVKSWVDNRVYLVDSPDNLNTDIEVATDGVVYISFAGAGKQIYKFKENTGSGWNDVNFCDVSKGEDICRAYYYRTAYYFTISSQGQKSDIMALTPERPKESQQGEKYMNPAMAAAPDGSILIVWQDNYENPNYDIWIKSLGSGKTGFCGDGQCNSKETCAACPEDCGPCTNVAGDANGDEKVTIDVLILFLQNYKKENFEKGADINKDGRVDIKDLIIIAKNIQS